MIYFDLTDIALPFAILLRPGEWAFRIGPVHFARTPAPPSECELYDWLDQHPRPLRLVPEGENWAVIDENGPVLATAPDREAALLEAYQKEKSRHLRR